MRMYSGFSQMERFSLRPPKRLPRRSARAASRRLRESKLAASFSERRLHLISLLGLYRFGSEVRSIRAQRRSFEQHPTGAATSRSLYSNGLPSRR
jgi:hypothetical protein